MDQRTGRLLLSDGALTSRLLQPPDVLARALGCSFGFCFGFGGFVYHHGQLLILKPACEANMLDGVAVRCYFVTRWSWSSSQLLISISAWALP